MSQKVVCNNNRTDTEWLRYKSAQNAQGWRNPDTGEIVYQEEPPDVTDESLTESTKHDILKQAIRLVKDEWQPYVGPREGVGWTDGNDVIYDEQPPGEIDQEAVDEFLEQLPEEDKEQARNALGLTEDRSGPSEWLDENLGDEYKIDLDSVAEGDIIEFEGRVKRVEGVDAAEDTIEISNTGLGDVSHKVQDGILLENPELPVLTEDVMYFEFDDDRPHDDGWYKGVDKNTFSDEPPVVETADGERKQLTDGHPSTLYKPRTFDELTHDMGEPWSEYNDQYPTDSQIEDTALAQSQMMLDSADESQQDIILSGLEKATEVGLVTENNVNTVTATDIREQNLVGSFMPETENMEFDIPSFTEETYEDRPEEHFVSERREDTVIHESVHAKHVDRIKNETEMTVMDIRKDLLRNLGSVETDIIADEVSRYGATNPMELVAEVGLKILKGEEVSDDVLALYEKYEGPTL